MVEEVSVVGDGDDGAGVLLEVLFEPVDRLCVEVVGGLVEQQHVRLLEQQAAEGHAAALTAGEGVDHLVVGGALEGVHGAFEFGVDIPGVGGVEGVLKLGLALDEAVHLVGVLQHVGVGESGVDLIELGKEVHYRLDTFAYNFDNSFARFEMRLLLEVAHGVARREYHFALVVLVDTGDDFQQ